MKTLHIIPLSIWNQYFKYDNNQFTYNIDIDYNNTLNFNVSNEDIIKFFEGELRLLDLYHNTLILKVINDDRIINYDINDFPYSLPSQESYFCEWNISKNNALKWVNSCISQN